ncbi:sensor histidine kinase [Adhaeribacter terreus]|uniref:histidine kinase n=1 Tax=Adhaeribacter terreus TaxID=529703 RepID=A0ABW0EB26_9BACT
MKFYFFSTVPVSSVPAFKAYYSPQNLKATRISAGIVGSISTILVALNLLFGYESLDANNPFYAQVNLLLAVICGFIFAGSFLPFQKLTFINPKNHIQLLSFAFSFFYTLSCLAVTLVQLESPKSSLTLYLLGLTAVAVLWNFEFRQHLLFIFLIEAAFILGMQTLQLGPNDQIQNYILSVFLLSFFYVAARLFYSFRANHFMQLQEIEKKNAEIQDISQAKSDILGVVAHDLLSPFASIEALINLLRKQKLPPEKQEQYFELVLSQCRTSRSLINDLLESARYENETSFLTEKTDINAFLEEICTKWKTQVKDLREINFIKPHAPLYANLNKERFSRVLDNLLANAVKFTFENGQITINLARKNKELLLYISDDGIGIPQNLHPYLFQRFSQARRKGLQGEDSTGLGLSITQQLVSQHGGSIKVESAENAGTTFAITLPAI